MVDVPRSEICLCGNGQFHVMLGWVIWCQRCGCLSLFRKPRYWRVPIDRAGELSSTVIMPDGDEDDEVPTRPGTPGAKRDSMPPKS